MTIKEFYDEIDGDFEGVAERLEKTERIQKFVCRFLEDQSYEHFVSSLKDGKMDDAFRAVHTLKGVSLNLGFTALGKIACAVTEALRREDLSEAKAVVPQLSDEYERIISSIKMLSQMSNV